MNWKYRPGGWTVKQVIHHCADSHMNSVMRFKLALTEETPEIRPYFEDKWANLLDSQDDDISASVTLLEGLHKKWAVLLKGLAEEDLKLEFILNTVRSLTSLRVLGIMPGMATII